MAKSRTIRRTGSYPAVTRSDYAALQKDGGISGCLLAISATAKDTMASATASKSARCESYSKWRADNCMKRDVSRSRKAAFRPLDQPSGDPSDVDAQSCERIIRAISPSPMKMSSKELTGRAIVVAKSVYLVEATST